MRSNQAPVNRGSGRKSRTFSVRLHPEPHPDAKDEFDEYEAVAFDHIIYNQGQGFTTQQILTDALCRAAGAKPEMFRQEHRIHNVVDALENQIRAYGDLGARLDAFEEHISAIMGDMLLKLREVDPEGLRKFAESDGESDNDENGISRKFLDNAKRAMSKTFKERTVQD